MIAVTILGNNSAMPTIDRHPTSQIVTINDSIFLMDCGEGTQFQMLKYKIRRSKISHIFISHLHGDHYLGLIGLISSFGILNHLQDLHVYGPSPLKEIIELQLKISNTQLPYQLFFHTITKEGLLLENDKFEVRCFKTNHRIACFGFVFIEKIKNRKLNIEKIKQFDIPICFYKKLEEGLDYITKDNLKINNTELTDAAPKGKIYAFCADTKYDESIIPHIRNADLIYHETTYLDNQKEKAELRFHSTSKQAALIAKKAEVKKLLIGHFSSKYIELDDFESEAKKIFINTEIATEGISYLI